MNTTEILTAKTANGAQWEIKTIEFNNQKPILVTGVIFYAKCKLQATWIAINGVCFVDDEPRREFNLIKN
jgi:hypothetical protein